jgi:hypothetical protein
MNTISNQKRRPPKPLHATAKRTKNALHILEMIMRLRRLGQDVEPLGVQN